MLQICILMVAMIIEAIIATPIIHPSDQTGSNILLELSNHHIKRNLNDGEVSSMICSVCIETVSKDLACHWEGCKHPFHADCVRPLFNHQKTAQCPNCRALGPNPSETQTAAQDQRVQYQIRHHTPSETTYYNFFLILR
ncbi:hypothetical protein PGTUg99_012264 [Puccinia graminis f. sp. tritici]|uniref:RING-type domain-containing protein n=1 Tax=Puccinia graminis f. sp. tritici TaxID=56615 RepID=A0A5B0SBT0_PUCGR|nr:hypothetical protein PGTUg99_012264 [Puccinia graminis f. sp. tritici]